MLRRYNKRISGFTLLEILVAIAIFVVIGALAMDGYRRLIMQTDRAQEGAARIRAVQFAVQKMAQDFTLLEPRPIRDPLGREVLPPLLSQSGKPELVELTRSGWSNPAGVPRSTLQRVAYRLKDGSLVRDYWVVLDRTATSEPVSVAIVDKVKAVSFRFQDPSRAWHQQWPPANFPQNQTTRIRPVAVEFTLELEDWGKIVRLVEVAG